jgi:hypothetical protein
MITAPKLPVMCLSPAGTYTQPGAPMKKAELTVGEGRRHPSPIRLAGRDESAPSVA